ncbi:MAG: TIM barrel protein [Clostridia bacterium]|nr:TIM barrel protein [Clostridia bacterium]
MLLGGTVAGRYSTPEEWEQLLAKSRFKAVTAPFNCQTPEAEIERYVSAARRQGVVIAEAGVWRNLFDPDPDKATANMNYAKGQLAMADAWGIPCCVNIVGTESSVSWDAADKSNFTPETYERIIACIREIIDSVKPDRAYYCIEPMPWMVPDSPETYLRLIQDVDRKQFGAHMDFVNMINCPRRYLDAEGFIDECFRTLGPFIKSTHLKDTRMHPTHLTTVLEECSPGEGDLNFENVLTIMNRYLPYDAPVLLEHMQTFEEYDRAYAYVAEQASKAGVSI